MALPNYASTGERVWYWTFRFLCGLIFIFLIAPILVIVPLSFNAEPYFSFTEGMLSFDSEAYSTRWYADILHNGMANPDAPASWGGFLDWVWQSTKATFGFAPPPEPGFYSDMWENAQWIRAMKNSFFIGIFATLISTTLGTLAAIGLSRAEMPYRRLIMSTLISPMIVPLVITAAGMFYFYSQIGLSSTYIGVILAHAALGTPFVIITVTATLVGFDKSLVRAGASLGANPVTTFWQVQMPLILPGVISGGLFAFITSFDEVVAVLFLAGPEQRTIPRQMYSGIREQISPTILAVATILVALSVVLLVTLELLRRRSERLRGITAS